MYNRCPVCAGCDFIEFDYPHASNAMFVGKKICVCKSCHFGALGVPLTEDALSQYYENEYGGVAKRDLHPEPKNYFGHRKRMYKVDRALSQLKLLKKYAAKTKICKILDLGAGLGTTLHFAGKYFNNAVLHAVEIESRAV